jgi:hypothetical protein
VRQLVFQFGTVCYLIVPSIELKVIKILCYHKDSAGLVAMRRAVAVTAILVMFFLMEPLALVEVADANPTWGKPATPIPPIKDPPQIIINSPSPTVYSNPVPLSITIIQPDSWITKQSMILPDSWTDNSDSVVVGQNTLRSITCIIDGQSIILWKGTPFGYGITYYLPKVTQFSAVMNVSKGQHNLQVNVLAVSEYVTEGIIPFAQAEYIISANQSTTFRVEDGSVAPMIDNIKSSYVIWQSSSVSMPSPTSAPPQSLNPPQNPTTKPSATPTVDPSPSPTATIPEFPSILTIAFLVTVILLVAIVLTRKQPKSKLERENSLYVMPT